MKKRKITLFIYRREKGVRYKEGDFLNMMLKDEEYLPPKNEQIFEAVSILSDGVNRRAGCPKTARGLPRGAGSFLGRRISLL